MRLRRVLPIAAMASMLTGCGPGSGIELEQARVLLPVVQGRPGSAYFLARTGSTGEGRLVRITSPQVERIELHESRSDGEVVRMSRMSSVSFDDIGEIDFHPGGKHAMLFGIDPSVKPGDKLQLAFHFEPGPKITVDADVLSFSGESHGAH